MNSTRKKQTKRGGKATEKLPNADSLDGTHPALKAKLAKIENQVHPIDKQCFLQLLLLTYVKPYLDLARKMVVSQRCHHQLPKAEQLFRTQNKMGRFLYSNGEKHRKEEIRRDSGLPDTDAGMCYEMAPTLRANILGAFLRAYTWQFSYILFIMLLNCFLQFLSVFAMKNGLDEVSSQFNTYHRMEDKEVILFWFIIVWLISLFNSVSQSWIKVEETRAVIRLVGGMHGIMFEKFLRIGVVNPHEHDEGSIISYLQSDVMRLYSSIMNITQFVTNIANLFLCLFIGVYFFQWIFLVMLGGLFVLGYSNKLVIAKIIFHVRARAKSMDKRLNLFKNVLKNIIFVKISALENIFFEKIDRIRVEEIKHNLMFTFYDAILDLIMAFGAALVIVLFLFCFFLAGGSFDVGTITVLLRVIDQLQGSLMGIPGGIGVLSSLFVSINRLALFLNSKELNSKRVRVEPDRSSKYAIEIKNGHFYWDKKMSKEEAEKIRTEKLDLKKKKKNKRAKKGGKKTKEESSSVKGSVGGSSLRQTLLTNNTELTTELAKPKEAEISDGRFKIEGINFKAERGKLTMIIGKIGSGKSSLLYSILGETMVGDSHSTSVHINDSVCFLSQNPWLINATVKQNILLNKEFNQEKFDWAIKYSALDHDLKNWELGENHLIGENGSTISGGQKARVALARCLYQE